MKLTSKKSYSHGNNHGDLRVGWASWDDGSYTARSIKWAYTDSSGKISRGAPELPFEILLDMLVYAADQGELNSYLPLVKSVHEKLGVILAKNEAKSND
jgi:hypothetical protein